MNVPFIEKYRARRVGGEAVPDLFGSLPSNSPDEQANGTVIKLDYEEKEEQWRPHNIALHCPLDWPWYPRRFVDGRDVGRTIAWLEDNDGFPIPMRLAQVGAAVLYADRELRGQFRLVVDRREATSVVALESDGFPWRDVEAFAAVLQARGYRLLVVHSTKDLATRCDFAALTLSTKSRTTRAMFELEQQMLHPVQGIPTILDGLLNEKIDIKHQREPIAGLIKTHSRIPLHTQGIQTLANLRPGQRTPVYQRILPDIEYVTWYLRLGKGGGDPQQRVVRVEICQCFFEEVMGKDFEYVNLLSRCLCDCKTHDQEYRRNAISIHPIQRTEEVIRAIFHGQESLENSFCQTMGINL